VRDALQEFVGHVTGEHAPGGEALRELVERRHVQPEDRVCTLHQPAAELVRVARRGHQHEQRGEPVHLVVLGGERDEARGLAAARAARDQGEARHHTVHSPASCLRETSRSARLGRPVVALRLDARTLPGW